MNLTTAETEELRLLFATGEACSLRGEEIEEVSLGAAIELACMRVSQVENVEVRNLLDAWAANLPVLGAAFDTMIRQSMPRRVDIFGVRIFEFFPIAAAWDDNDHHLFEARFDAGLRNAGFGKYSKAFVGAFREMADNIIQHSGPVALKPARGLIGYYVSDGKMAYALGDVGRGVLASLHENPEWQNLQDSADALNAIITKGASRRISCGEGGGFKQLFKSLADMNGFITLRSGNGSVRIQGSPSGRIGKTKLAEPFSGFQLSVTCSLKNEPSEIFIKDC